MTKPSKSTSSSAGATSSKDAAAAATHALAAQSALAASAPSSSSTSSLIPASTPLQVFWDLAKEDASDRNEACQRLLTGLQAEQKGYQPSSASDESAKSKKKHDEDSDESMDDDDDDDDEPKSSSSTTTTTPRNLCPSLTYALKRLTRGLASSRAGARPGFSLALTEILTEKSLPVKTDDAFHIAMEQVKLNAKSNKQETRDYHLARVCFFLVLLRSKRLPELKSTDLIPYVKELLEYGKANLPIREFTYETIIQLISGPCKLTWKQYSALPELQKLLLSEFTSQSLENLSIEQVGLSLVMKEFYMENGKELPSSSSSSSKNDDAMEVDTTESKESSENKPLLVTSSVRKLFSSKYLPQLHTSMFSSMQHYSIDTKLHKTWKHIILHLWKYYSFEKFQSFWEENVEKELFGGVLTQSQAQQVAGGVKSTSYSKKFIAFQVVEQILREISGAFKEENKKHAAADSTLATSSPDQILSLLFRSRNFMRTFMNNLPSAKHVLYSSTQSLKAVIIQFAKSRPDSILTIISHLEDSSSGGHQRFDARTNSNLVVKLLEGLNAEGVEKYVEKLIETFLNAVPVVVEKSGDETAAPAPTKKGAAQVAAIASSESTDLAQQALDSTRLFCIEQIFLLARNKNLPQSNGAGKNEWMKRALSFLFYFGFFTSSSDSAKNAPFPNPTHPLSEKTLAVLNEKLFHLLNELIPHAPVTKRVNEKEEKKQKSSKKSKDEDESMENDDDESEESKAANTASLASFHSLFTASSTSQLWSLQLHHFWDQWTKGTKSSITLLDPISKEEKTARTSTLAFVHTLREKYEERLTKVGQASLSEEDKTYLNQLRQLQLLLLHLSLLLLRVEDREFATPLIEELQEGAQQELFTPAAPVKKSSKKAAATPDADKPQFINVLIDILLSLLIRPSTLFRDIAKNTFLAFIEKVNEEAIDELLLVLRKKEKVGGAEGDDEDEDSDNFNSDEDEEEEEEEEQKSNKKGGKGGAANNKKDDKKSEESKEDSKKPFDPRARMLKPSKKMTLNDQAIANAAKYAKYAMKEGDDSEDDEEMIDIDALNEQFKDSDEDEEAGNDSALTHDGTIIDKYDIHLGAIVKLRGEKKLIHKETIQQTLHFKLRVCDLCEVFIRHASTHTNPLIFRMYIPMLLAIDATRGSKDMQPLLQRVVGLHKKLCQIKEFSDMNSEREKSIRDLMTLLMSRGTKTFNRETLHLTNLSILSLAKMIVPKETKEQVEGALALVSGKKTKSVTDSSIAFVLSLYRTELISYLSVRHASQLNTKFFTEFFSQFPGLAWTFVEELSNLARAKLPEAYQVPFITVDESKKSKKSSSSASSSSTLYASSSFRRIECFTLLLHIFQNRKLLKENELVEKFTSSLPVMIEAIRSSLVVVTLPKSVLEAAGVKEEEKKADDEDDDEDDSDDEADESKEDSNDKSKKPKLSKEEKLKLKARAKKKRRLAKQKAEAKAEQLAAEGKIDPAAAAAKAEHETLKSNINRLKVVLKFANQAALAFEPKQMFSTLTPTLSALPSQLVTPLKSAIHTFLTSAKVDVTSVKLQVDTTTPQEKKMKLQQQQQKEQQQKKAASAKKKDFSSKPNGKTAAASTSPSAASSAEPIKKKSNNRNLIQPSTPSTTSSSSSTSAPSPKEKSKKRPVEESDETKPALNGHPEKKQKTTEKKTKQ